MKKIFTKNVILLVFIFSPLLVMANCEIEYDDVEDIEEEESFEDNELANDTIFTSLIDETVKEGKQSETPKDFILEKNRKEFLIFILILFVGIPLWFYIWKLIGKYVTYRAMAKGLDEIEAESAGKDARQKGTIVFFIAIFIYICYIACTEKSYNSYEGMDYEEIDADQQYRIP